MNNLLFLVHRIPFPPDKGDKIRSFNLLRHLSKTHNVYLGGFVDRDEDWQHVAELEKFCTEVRFERISPWRSKLSALAALLTRKSLSIAYYADEPLRQWAIELAASVDLEVVIAFSSTMVQFVPNSATRKSIVLADFVDLDSDKWRQYAIESHWPLSAVYRYEARALSRWESEVLERVDAVTLVSDEECRLARRQFGARAENVGVVRNGVDAKLFDPDVGLENPYLSDGPIVLFTGAMDYFANVHGVKWFVETAWPMIRARVPSAEFWIVGSNPTRDVEVLESVDGVTVTGFVSDIRQYLKHADLAIAPLSLARGVQNKVLEALAMNLPVVATPQALQGLDGELPDTIVSASDPDDIANAIVRLIATKRSASGTSGRDYIRRYYDWSHNLSEINRLVAAAQTSNTQDASPNNKNPEGSM